MQVAKWGNSLAIRIPKAVAETLGLKEGDDVQITVSDKVVALAKDDVRARSIERIRAMARTLPEDWKFDRDEANAR